MKSEQTNELAMALSKAQGEMKHAHLDRVNPHYKSKFASLASCMDAGRGPLSKNGLAIVSALSNREGVLILKTFLLHGSGQWIACEMPVPGTTPQQVGSSLSYARRYTYCALTGVVGDEDDDGEEGSRKDPPKVTHLTPKPKPAMQKVGDVLNKDGLPPVAGEYVITWGVARNCKIKTVPPDVLDGYCKRIRDRAAELGKEIDGEPLQFMKNVELFHKGVEQLKGVEIGNGD